MFTIYKNTIFIYNTLWMCSTFCMFYMYFDTTDSFPLCAVLIGFILYWSTYNNNVLKHWWNFFYGHFNIHAVFIYISLLLRLFLSHSTLASFSFCRSPFFSFQNSYGLRLHNYRARIAVCEEKRIFKIGCATIYMYIYLV